MKTLKKQFQNSSLKVKIQLILFSCILFLFIVTFIGIYCVSNSFENALYHSASSSLSYSASNIESHLKQIDDLADSIFSDSLIQEQRLLLAYGNDYGLRLINAEDELTGEEYAIVQIALPAILSETEEHISQSILNENAERKNPK